MDQTEPSRAVLLRSVASLAGRAGQRAEALRLMQLALSGEPPAEIADELQMLLREREGDVADDDSDEPTARHALREAKRFAGAVGGIERARKSSDGLSRLRS